MECLGGCFYFDGVIIPADGPEVIPEGEVSFYEVIRTRNGIPVFFDDHLNRLREGISTRYDLKEDITGEVKRGLTLLADKVQFNEINVKVTVAFTGQDHTVHICFIPSSYPSKSTQEEGVSLILYHAERFDPGVKMLNARLRASVNQELARRNAYEALLVNHDGSITEGSRSNIFFITDSGLVHTAPDNMILSGITRKYVSELILQEGIRLIYKAVREDETGLYRSAFITGTSPMVLAVKSIEKQRYDVTDPLIERLLDNYRYLVERNVREYMLRNKRD